MLAEVLKKVYIANVLATNPDMGRLLCFASTDSAGCEMLESSVDATLGTGLNQASVSYMPAC